ncbi:hypothetical protein XarbCFBP8147_13025 [Xanthomonas arboricola]|nr:hypothetical protein XarbCFBP8147_13025 [Xanthomonas arboricola]
MFFASTTTHANERPLTVPTDAKATYAILQVGGKFPIRTIVTKRIGSSGTSYSKRIYNCSNNTVKYLGTGDTLSDMARSKPDPNMGPIVAQSIADYVGREACKR